MHTGTIRVLALLAAPLALCFACKSSSEGDTIVDATSESDASSGSSSESTGSETSPTGDAESESSESESSESESSESESSESESSESESSESESSESESSGTGQEGPCEGVCGSLDCGECPDAPMIEGAGYAIDQTEVTVGDYAMFLALEHDLSVLDSSCEWKPDFGGFEPELWDTQINDDLDAPVAGVDWCDSETYCRWAGKRLCGSIGGAPPNFDEIETPQDEWYQACSGGGVSDYPYGNNYESLACNGWELGVAGVVPVATLPACEGGLPDLFDMSGNLWEWTGACADLPNLQNYEQECRRRGGSWFTDDGDLMRCGVKSRRHKSFRSSNLGFRCCAAD